MDPISLAASIAGLISLVDLAVTRGTRFYYSFRDAPKEILQLIGEAAALSGVLSALTRIVEQKTHIIDSEMTAVGNIDSKGGLQQLFHGNNQSLLPDAPEKTAEKMEPILIQSCRETLEQLRDIIDRLEERPGDTLKNARKKLRWVSKEDAIRILVAKIERHKSSFQLAISADSLSQIQQLLAGTSSILANMDSVKTELQSEIRAIALQQKQEREDYLRREREHSNREILEFLSPVTPNTNHSAAQKFQQEGTGRWFLDGEGFRSWLSADNSFLWVHGIAGAGKTILTSLAIDELQTHCRSEDHRLAYFYCDFRDNKFRDPVNLIGSIIGQLVMQETNIPERLLDLYETHSKSRARPSLQALLDHLANVLEGTAGFRKTYIVVDAIDECTDREDLLIGLNALPSLPDLKVNILIASRGESDIKDAFDGLPSLRITESDIASDVELYVLSEIEKRKSLKGKPSVVKSRIQSALVTGAKGMFRWVKCQLDVISKARTTKAVYEALNALPIGLDETYERILANIDDDDFELASNALRWITCSIRPLNIDELVEAIAVAPGQKKMDEEIRLSNPADIGDICGNLVDSTSNTIKLAHYSVEEFLTSKRLLTKPSRISRYAITTGSGHREIGNICLTYLSFEDFNSGPCRNSEMLRLRLKTYPLLDYAARYWGRHSALGDVELEGPWLKELFSKPGNVMLLNLLEVTSYQDRKSPTPQYEGRFYDDENEGIICVAVRFGFILLAKKLLDGGADVNAQGGRYGNVLQLAANLNDASLVKLLLEKGANVNATGGYFGNALQAASIGGNLETILTLLEAGADVNTRGGCLETCLQAAALNGHVGVVKLFLERGADVNSTGGYHGCALRAAAFDSNIEIARILLEHGADVNAKDNSCRSALEGAAGSGSYELVKLLLDHGANVNPRLSDDTIDGNRSDFSTPLVQAARCGYGDIVKLLLQSGADVNAVDIWPPLCASISFGDNVLIDTLLKAGADINGRWSIAGNPLSEAVRWRHHGMCQSFLSRGANPNGSGWFTGWDMPLISAACYGTKEDIQLLIENGANVNATGAFTGTAVQQAALKSMVENVRILVDYGADINLRGGLYGSPLLAAASSGSKELVEMFLSLGASTSTTDCFGFNIGHYFKYEWCSLAKHEIMSTGLDDSLSGIDRSRSRETIRACIRAIRDTVVNTSLFEYLGRGLLAYGLEDEAATSFERRIRRIGDQGIFVHVGRVCDNCDTADNISGPRYVCKLCWNCDLCKQCHSHERKSHGVKSGDLHEFLEVPQKYWPHLAKGVVNKSGEKLNQWLDRLETLFKD